MKLLRRILQRPSLRQAMVLFLDGGIGAASLWVAMMLRFEGNILGPYLQQMPVYFLLLACARVGGSYLCRLHQWSFRFSGLTDAARVGLGAWVGSGVFLGLLSLFHVWKPPRSVLVLELLLSALLMGALRYSPRLAGVYLRDWIRNRSDGALRTLIVGSGAAGVMLLRDLRESPEHDYQVVGFVDDDPAKWNHLIGGKSVLGGIDELPHLVQRCNVDQVLIAIPRLPAKRIREILTLCARLKLRFKILPVSFVYVQEQAAASMIQDLAPEDLLPREAVTFCNEPAAGFASRLALITGGAGSIGSEICRQLLRAGMQSLVLVDVDENGLYMLQRRLEREYPGREITVRIANVRDRERMRTLFRDHRPQDVFHAAAHKHVPLLEAAPCEAVRNNILGTRNMVEIADEFGTARFLYISTDKAVRPTSVMGASKRVGEEIVRAMARRSKTQFCAVRFGNVLGSAGSVVQIFREQIAAGGPVTVTHRDVRRYFMTISEAVSLVLQAAYGDFGEMCVLDMGEQIRILDLARHMITIAGRVPDMDIHIEFTGLRAGEKLFEELLTEEEERTRRVDSKIFAADCQAPREDLNELIDILGHAAEEERPQRVVALLRELVPSFEPAEIHGRSRLRAV